MSDDDNAVARRKEMFAWHGSTMYASQLLEQELAILHLVLRRTQEPNLRLEELDAFDSQLSRRTLGRLVRNLEKHPEPAPQLAATLTQYVELRNDLAHHFFKRHDASLMTSHGIEAMISELQDAYEKLRKADALATEVSVALRKKMGWSEEALQAMAAAEIAHRLKEAGCD
jgi:hypothetical protein